MAKFQRENVPGFQRHPGLFYLPGKDTEARLVPPENEVVRFCEGCYGAAKYWRDTALGMQERWQSYRQWYLHTGISSVNSQQSNTYVNMIYEKVESGTAEVTASRPEFLFTPPTPSDVPITELLNEAVPWIWEAHGMQQQYGLSVKSADLYGTWYWKIIHDPRYAKTGGTERIIVVPVWNLFPAPYAVDFETAPWVIEISVRTVGEIYADYGVEVQPDIGLNDLMPPIDEDLKNPPVSSTVQTVASPDGGVTHAGGDTVSAIPESYMSTHGRPGLVIQKEMWIRDGSLQAEYQAVEDGPPRIHESYTMKYPRGRVISWANGRLLYDRPNPYADGRFPYVKFVDVPVPDFWFGMGEVEPLINLQLLHDDTHEIIKAIHLFQAGGRLVIGENTGLSEDQVGGEPGEIYFVKPGTVDQVKWLTGAPVPAEIYNYIALLERSADLVSGRWDVSRGVAPTGVTAGKALATLQNAGSKRVRMHLNDIEGSLIKAARLIGSRVQQFWPDNMSVRIAGPEKTRNAADAGAFQFRDFSISEYDRQAQYNVQVMALGNKDQLMDVAFQKMMVLAQMGVPIGPEMMIEAADLPYEDKIKAQMYALAARRAVPPQANAVPPSQRPELQVVGGGNA